MRVLLTTYGSRGDVEPLIGLALELRRLGAEVVVCAPPDFAPRLAEVGVAMVPFGPSAKALTKAKPPPDGLPRRAAEVIAGLFEAVLPAAEGCDVLLTAGMMPAAAGARSVAEKLGIDCVYTTFEQQTLPSPHHPPLAYAGRPFPPGAGDLWEFDAQTIDDLFGEALNVNRATIGLPPVENVRDYVHGDRPWLASDPVLDPCLDPGVLQTGAWFAPDTRPLPADLLAFLDAGPPPVYVGFGSMPVHIPAEVVGGHRVIVSRGWGELDETGSFVVGEVNHQALFGRVAAVIHHGGAGTTTTAARAGAPQVVLPQAADQPYWARRVTELGIGAAIATFDELPGALASLDRARALEVSATIRTDGAATAAAHLTRRPQISSMT
ncbi:glycosyltransferase [Herbidospora mongoliensis]|uniref:glycosyltransferase n=1 Tax=Herbidospora mongoliensis TaxID=688067 RepID=UPI000836E4D4|nr:glycosyltransferase [Herbidospora mongoliensis]